MFILRLNLFFLPGVAFLPMLINCSAETVQPFFVLREFQDSFSGEIFRSVLRRIARGLTVWKRPESALMRLRITAVGGL